MTIQHLQYILEVQRTGSVSRAAKCLYISQSTISACITALENELGYPIFTRTRQGMVATEKGLKVLEYAGRICENYHAMLQNDSPAPRLFRIGGGTYQPCANAIAQLIMEYTDRNDVTIQNITHAPADLIVRKVASRDLELGILKVLTPKVANRERQLRNIGLEWRLGRAVPAVIKVSSNHPLYHKKDATFADVAEFPIVDKSALAIVNNQLLNEIVPIDRKKAIIVDNPHIRRQLINSGIAYAIGPQSLVSHDAPCDYRYIPIGDLTYTLILVMDPARPRYPEMERFIELIDEELSRI